METIAKFTSVENKNDVFESPKTNFWKEMEANRFWFPFVLIIVACISGTVASITLKDGIIKLMAIGLSTTMLEALILAVAPIRILIGTLITALLINLLAFVF
jgi:hypothetical protein